LGWAVGLVYISYDTFLLGFTATQLWPLRRAMRLVPPPAADAPRGRMGAIIAAWNEEGSLQVTIDRLAAQDDAPEVIVLA
ncbi:hypothetical protein ACEWAJ_24465, partial [Vibrio parahaemolyticus]